MLALTVHILINVIFAIIVKFLNQNCASMDKKIPHPTRKIRFEALFRNDE